MSVKYLSLSVVSAAVAVLVAGVVSIASKAGSFVKKPPVSPVSLVIPQPKPERSTETSDLKLGLDIYMQRIAAQGKTTESIPVERVAGNSQANRLGNANQLFAGAEVKSSASVVAGAIPRPLSPPALPPTNKSMVAKVAAVAGAIPPERGVRVEMPKVAVVVIDGISNKAIINGSLVTVNSQLYGGYVVKEINIDNVIVMHGKEQYVIKIPLERLRVLGAPEAVRTKGV